MNIMGEVAPYVGIPYSDNGRDRKGCDCFGLLMLVYAEQLGVQLPDLDLSYTGLDARASATFMQNYPSEEWGVAVQNPEPWDCMVFRRGKYESHVALYLGDGYMLEVSQGQCASISKFETSKWRTRLSRILRLKTLLRG